MSSDEFIVDGRDVRTLPMAQRVKLWADTGANMLDRQPDITDEYSDFVRMFEERLDPITRASYLDHFEDAAQYREEMHQLYQFAHWAKFGFNMFRLSEDLVTGLLMTEPAPITEADPLCVPFPCFFLQLPPKTIPIFLEADEFVWAECLWVHQFRSQQQYDPHTEPWFRWTLCYKSLRLWRDRPQSLLGSDFVDQSFYGRVKDPPPLPKQDDLALGLALRLIRNLSAWLDCSGGLGKQHKQQRSKKQQRRKKKDKFRKPTVWLLGQEVRLPQEMHERREDYALGRTKKAPKGWHQRVRSIVTGHWKMQVYGPGRSLRKRKWIEPYWRNEDESLAYGHLYTEAENNE